MKLSSRHLAKPSRHYCFRLVIPERLRPHFGCREIKKSLRTGNLIAAATLATELRTRIKILMHLAAEEDGAMDASLRTKITQFVAAYVRDVLDTDETINTFSRKDPADVPRVQAIMDGLIEEARAALIANDFSGIAQEIRGLLPPNNPDFFGRRELGADEYRQLCRQCLKGKIQSLKISKARAAGDYDNEYDRAGAEIVDAARALANGKPLKDSEPAPAAATPSGMTLGKAVAAFTKEKTTGNRWGAKTRVIAQGVFRLLTEEFGEDADLAMINYAKLAAFRDDVMAKLPANRGKFTQYQGKTAREIVAMPDVTPMSHATLQKNTVWISSLFRWAAKHDYIQKNPADGLRPAGSNHQSASSQRDAYTNAELQTMVTALNTERAAQLGRPERYWVPLIGMLNGMRLDEVCQLAVDDVKQVGGIWCFDVNTKGGNKHVKTAASVRVIPVHPKLIDLGLLDHVEALRQTGETRLWPRLKPYRDGYGQAFSKWFADFNDRHITADRKKVFHSLRHNFSTALKAANVQESTIAELMGHENPSITTGRYGKRLEPDKLLAELRKLDYGITFKVAKAKKKATK